MNLSKTQIRALALVVGGAAVGALATAASSGLVGAPTPIESVAPTAAPEAQLGAAERPLDLDLTPPLGPPPVVRQHSFGSPSDASIDPRFLSAPLSERFTQWSRGASNPGVRGARHEDPMSNMIALVFPADEASETVVLAPRVNPPPDETGETEEPPVVIDGGGNGGNGGGGIEPPAAGVPEIDAGLLGTGLLLLLGGALVLTSRRVV